MRDKWVENESAAMVKCKYKKKGGVIRCFWGIRRGNLRAHPCQFSILRRRITDERRRFYKRRLLFALCCLTTAEKYAMM